MIIKIAPDLDEAERADIAAVVIETGVDGMIVANTTVLRPSQMTDPQTNQAGTSGATVSHCAEIVGNVQAD